ncbi:class I SAM-dependent methyltransferase [Nocardiopsis suaedae]|uniref:Class I SAM-dependent methyltransferase n=1 Tax=Nocardiopsis suaedae TaxID=3018444 RepID=A0ABT4TH71_9ACTN|nr:class I SAM-dependent methyltransferase [Nocardiopsis suaedae]MDA2804011.1 class I SAM-dependent methyltransferase [Nocardiopsis suaedae]
MSVPEHSGFAPYWLALREPADAAARDRDLAAEAARELRRPDAETPLVIRDLGGGTGSMARWLAPLLPGPQHWIVYDHDPGLLERAREHGPRASADGRPVTVETRTTDLMDLREADLRGAGLVTASALLDLFTREEVEGVVAACVGARCPALFTMSVKGRVTVTPGDPLDREIQEAFNAHQRREGGGRALLGPHAVEAAAEAFTRAGARVVTRPSPWRLGADRRALAAEWLEGWVRAAVEQCPDLATRAERYLSRRRAECADGGLYVEVQHEDVLALPPGERHREDAAGRGPA